MTRRLFAIEQYDSSGRGAPPPPPALDTDDTRLVAAVHLPADDVVLALVEGPDAAAVAAAAAAAGWRVDRLNPARWITPGSDPARRKPDGRTEENRCAD
ncbi:hypothetical protein SAMN05444365_109146 [Micromonospora pattaloongensis]|uniref:Uncharacterized protein n=1 Tax=Micromonospora pattaloongensis TaxID=405436 RepID=A0A1H3RY23_9ACTN|nr:hypothetical protein [Micromonospora pattaloongensis]SDZ30161.1 hypothetical protein SAMN05444365_109146 [Micromonospora pattaloongensis]